MTRGYVSVDSNTHTVSSGRPSSYTSLHTTVQGKHSPTPSPQNIRRQEMSQTDGKALLEDKLFRKRLNLKELRNELRQERDTTIGIEAQLYALLRNYWAKGSPPEKNEFEELYIKLQKCRDELGTLQYQYDEMEDEYDTIEAELNELDPPVVELDQDGSQNDHHLESTPYRVGEHYIPSTSPTADGDQIRDDTILRQFQSRVGDGNILWEQLQDTSQQYQMLLQFARFRALAITDLEQRNRQQVQDRAATGELEAAFSEGRSALEVVENDVKILAGQAANAGFVVDLPFWVVNEEPQREPGDTVSVQEEVSLDPELHQNRDTVPPLSNKTYSTRAKVNVWILEQMEGSDVERVRHRDALEAELERPVEKETWARSLLIWWDSDELGESDLRTEVLGEQQKREVFSGQVKKRPSSAMSAKLTVLVKTTAEIAIHDFDRRFPLSGPLPKVRSRIYSLTYYRSNPYEDGDLEFDVLSLYTSHSIS